MVPSCEQVELLKITMDRYARQGADKDSSFVHLSLNGRDTKIPIAVVHKSPLEVDIRAPFTANWLVKTAPIDLIQEEVFETLSEDICFFFFTALTDGMLEKVLEIRKRMRERGLLKGGGDIDAES